MSARAAKAALRREMSSRAAALDAAERARAGESLAAQILACPEFAATDQLALYAALPDEVPTRALFAGAERRGKSILMPRWLGSGALEFVPVEAWQALREGRRGLLEPGPDLPPGSLGRGDLVIVPGRAFDRQGGRLGRGVGAYDRAFPVGTHAPLLFGACFGFQLVESVPRERFDRQMDAIVSDTGVVRIRST